MKKKRFALAMVAVLAFAAPIVSGQGSHVIAQAAVAANFNVAPNVIPVGTRQAKVDDIVITEAKAGYFKKGKAIYLQGEHLQFEKGIQAEVISGDLTVKKVESDGDTIKITIDEESGSVPSAIRLTNISLFLDQSLPEGQYALKLVTKEDDRFRNNVFGETYGDNDELGKFDTEALVLLDKYVTLAAPEATYPEPLLQVEVGQKTMLSGDNRWEMDVAAYENKEGFVMLPLRKMGEGLAKALTQTINVSWDETEKYVVVDNGQISKLRAGETSMIKNGTETPFHCAPEIFEDRIFLSAEDMALVLGVNVSLSEQDNGTKVAQFYWERSQ